MSPRPKIIIKLSGTDRMIEALCWLLLGAMWVYTFLNYSSLPEKIPVHFNGAGVADDYGTKATIFLFTGIGTLIFIGLTVLNKYPHSFNYLEKITEKNALTKYTQATKMVRSLKLSITVILFFSVYEICLIANEKSEGFGLWFLPIALCLVLLPVIIFVIKSLKK